MWNFERKEKYIYGYGAKEWDLWELQILTIVTKGLRLIVFDCEVKEFVGEVFGPH